MRQAPLTRKLWRELWRMRGQAVAIAFVIAGGIATWVISLSTLDSLRRTQDQFYSEQRFADVFVDAVRAPRTVLARLREMPGVNQYEARVQASVNLELPNFDEPITGLALSLPDRREAAVNAPVLRAGRMPQAGQPLEALVSDAFAEVQALRPGDALALTVEGRRVALRISGIASSPEFLVQLRPGDLFPDYRRYGIVWLRERELAALTDMDGAFNSLVLRAGRATDLRALRAGIDELLERYGGAGAYTRDRHASHRYLSEELQQLATLASIFPVIFMAVAAFLLSLVMNRIVRQQREEIAMLKAFGYANRTIGTHYLYLVLTIVAFGSLLGVTLGTWLAHALASVYSDFFRFPYLAYRLAPSVAISGVLIAAAAAVLGTLRALRQVWRLTPAEAMRPETPERYRIAGLERMRAFLSLSLASRMIVRHLARHPLKSAFTVAGLAVSVAILMVGSFQEDAIDYMTQVQFGLAAREDLTVQFHRPQALELARQLRNAPGVVQLEPFRAVPATLRYGHREMRLALQAFEYGASLHRPLDESLATIALPPDGIVLSEYYARELGVRPGDAVAVEVHSGRRPVLSVPVSDTVREYVGSSAYLRLDLLNRLLGESPQADGVFLATAGAPSTALFEYLHDMPAVAGVTRRDVSLAAFEETMGETILIFAFVNTLLAGSIAFGVIYNSARVALSERDRELASLRVLGLTRREVAWILSGELLLLALLALPIGIATGYGLCWLIATRMTSELYRVPLVVEPSTGVFAVSVALAALMISLLIVRQRTGRLDLVGVLKSRE